MMLILTLNPSHKTVAFFQKPYSFFAHHHVINRVTNGSKDECLCCLYCRINFFLVAEQIGVGLVK